MDNDTLAHNAILEWQPITDLPEDLTGLRRDDLRSVLESWQQEKISLRDPTRLLRLEEQMKREWAIETGLIEGLYKIDRGLTETMVKLGLHAAAQAPIRPPESSAIQLIEDQEAALNFVFQFIKDERRLTSSYLKELHQLLCRNQEFVEKIDQFGTRIRTRLSKGAWKLLPNNPSRPDGSIHEYCPPEFVQDEIDQLLTWHEQHEDIPPEVEAAWLHHRFTQIHPFEDGNGRVARAIATLVLLRVGFLPLVIRDVEDRESYIGALEAADRGDLKKLVDLFADIVTRDTAKAIGFVRSMVDEDVNVREIGQSAAQIAKRRRSESDDEVDRQTEDLLELARGLLDDAATQLRAEFTAADVQLDASVEVSVDETDHYWTEQIIDAAQNFGYWVDLKKKRRWASLKLSIPVFGGSGRARIVTSFHHGKFAGSMSATMFLTSAPEAEGRGWETALSDEAELFRYSTKQVNTDERFKEWFARNLSRTLDLWQQRL